MLEFDNIRLLFKIFHHINLGYQDHSLFVSQAGKSWVCTMRYLMIVWYRLGKIVIGAEYVSILMYTIEGRKSILLCIVSLVIRLVKG